MVGMCDWGYVTEKLEFASQSEPGRAQGDLGNARSSAVTLAGGFFDGGRMSTTQAEQVEEWSADQERGKVMERDGRRCRSCHEKKNRLRLYNKEERDGMEPEHPWEWNDEELVTMCERCHEQMGEVLRLVKEVVVVIGVEATAEC